LESPPGGRPGPRLAAVLLVAAFFFVAARRRVDLVADALAVDFRAVLRFGAFLAVPVDFVDLFAAT